MAKRIPVYNNEALVRDAFQSRLPMRVGILTPRDKVLYKLGALMRNYTHKGVWVVTAQEPRYF